MFRRLPRPAAALCLLSLLPKASATPSAAAGAVDTVGLWLGFVLVFVVSATEALASIIWTQVRVTKDNVHPHEVSCRVCGRQMGLSNVDANSAQEIAKSGLPGGCYTGSISSVTYSSFDEVVAENSSGRGCSIFGGFETRQTRFHEGIWEAVIDKHLSVMLVATLLIRRFNPSTGLLGAAGLLNNIKDLRKPKKNSTTAHVLEHSAHLLIGLIDISLGIAGLALNPSSPKMLYETLKDKEAPITFENYLTLFLLYWILGVVLLLSMIPLSSKSRSVQILGWPGFVAAAVASLANVVLFGLGCWKIDYARRHHLPWTPMLSYWIGGAGAIQFPIFGVEVFHTFGCIGLGLMLVHTF